jgi:hypothetical protein
VQPKAGIVDLCVGQDHRAAAINEKVEIQAETKADEKIKIILGDMLLPNG